MSAQKRSFDEILEENAVADEINNNQQERPEGVEFNQSRPLDNNEDKKKDEEEQEYVFVSLSDLRKEVQCPICLGIIRKTRTIMECLHRFCGECIDKSIRLGYNECPTCHTHCASPGSLRDDPNYDALVAAIFPDIDKYEEEEILALREDDEVTHNKQSYGEKEKQGAGVGDVLEEKNED